MQCASCQFENMPGTQLCARCGTSLLISGAEFDVHPPRASWLGRKVRFANRWVRRLADQAVNARDQMGRRARYVAEAWALPMPPGDILRLLVPGWPQLHERKREAGLTIAGGFGLCVVLGALWFGTFLGSVMLGMAFAIHCLGTLNATANDWSGLTMAGRARRGVVAIGLLGMCVYGPLMWGVSWVADASVVNTSMGALSEGDVILIHHLRPARVGDVVRYEMPWGQGRLAEAIGHFRYYRFGGVGIDRIVAGPGDQVVVRQRRLFVNGRPAGVMPMNPLGLPEELTFPVPDGSFAILPTSVMGIRNAEPSIWVNASVIPAEQIQGIAYWRHGPWARRGYLK